MMRVARTTINSKTGTDHATTQFGRSGQRSVLSWLTGRARAIWVVRQEDVWFIRFDGDDYGPYKSEREAMLFAVDAANKLGEQGEETQVLVMDENGDAAAAPGPLGGIHIRRASEDRCKTACSMACHRPRLWAMTALMRTDLFDFDLPADRIALRPSRRATRRGSWSCARARRRNSRIAGCATCPICCGPAMRWSSTTPR